MSNFKGYPNEYALVEFALNKHSSRHIVGTFLESGTLVENKAITKVARE